MTMFDWTPEQPDKPTTSGKIWIYWAVTIPLTALVFTVWRLWWKIDDTKYQKEACKGN